MSKLLTDRGLNVGVAKVELDGEAYKVFKKNKWCVMYELHGEIELNSDDNKAKIKITELTNFGDREFELTGHSDVKKLVESEKNQLIKIVEDVLASHA